MAPIIKNPNTQNHQGSRPQPQPQPQPQVLSSEDDVVDDVDGDVVGDGGGDDVVNGDGDGDRDVVVDGGGDGDDDVPIIKNPNTQNHQGSRPQPQPLVLSSEDVEFLKELDEIFQPYEHVNLDLEFAILFNRGLFGGGGDVVVNGGNDGDRDVVVDGGGDGDGDGDRDVVVDGDDADDFDFSRMPPGWRFVPTDETLVLDYLKPKLENKLLPISKIQEVDIYKHHPQNLAELYEKCNEREWYFFTPRDKKYPNGRRPARNADKGYWKASGADTVIYSMNRVVGTKRSLSFHNGRPPNGKKTDWIMHEYCYGNPASRREIRGHGMRLDWALCKIYKKKNSQQDQQDPGENSEQQTQAQETRRSDSDEHRK